jgi:tripartite-type tricarboxylate transporter receptor subunit TctC
MQPINAFPPRRRTVLAALAGGALAPLAHADEGFPSRPIRFVIAGGAGGSTDGIVRMVSARAATLLGQPIVIENRPGGGGVVGTMVAAQAPADGHTLLFGATYNMATNVTLVRNLPYEPLKAFTPVTRLFDAHWMLVVHPKLGVNTIAELVALAKKKPGGLNYASFGNGNGSHLAMEVFKSQTGTHIVHIPYQTPGAAVTALVSGQVDLAFLSLDSSPHVKSGALKAIGYTGSQRSPILPDVPTMAEGVPGYFYTSWGGVVTNAGTPPAVIDKLNQAYTAALNTPEIREKIRDYGAEAMPSTPDAFRTLIVSEIPRLGQLIRRSGAKVD